MTQIGSFPANALVVPLSLGGDGPCLAVKDCLDIAGTVTGCGSEAFAGSAPADQHADVVARVLDRGCRILGRANMHEMAFGMTGVNGYTGTPVNPLWPDRIPGGSSSGSAVSVAAGAVDFAIGTDTGGSVRQPAICCGVAGFKPTWGRISRKGAIPATSSLDCIGPFAPDAGGIERAMQLMDPGFLPVALGFPPKLLRIAAETTPEIAETFEAALRSAGLAGLPQETLSLLGAAFEAGMVVINAETYAAFGHFVRQEAPMGSDVRGRIARAGETTAEALARAEDIRRDFTAEVDRALEQADALLLPALPVVPPTLDEARDPMTVLPLTRLLRPFNLSGHPALVLPLRTRAGLPAGLQIVGRKNDDARVCAIAKWLASRLSKNIFEDEMA